MFGLRHGAKANVSAVATVMDGKALAGADSRRGERRRSRSSASLGLATILVGDDPASEIYIRLKHKAATRGRASRRRTSACLRTHRGRAASTASAALNGDEAIDGMLVQLPLPAHIDEARVIRAIDAGQGRGRPASVQRGPPVPRPADARRRRRRSGSWRCSSEYEIAARPARRPSSSGGATSSASPSRICCCSSTRP